MTIYIEFAAMQLYFSYCVYLLWHFKVKNDTIHSLKLRFVLHSNTFVIFELRLYILLHQSSVKYGIHKISILQSTRECFAEMILVLLSKAIWMRETKINHNVSIVKPHFSNYGTLTLGYLALHILYPKKCINSCLRK